MTFSPKNTVANIKHGGEIFCCWGCFLLPVELKFEECKYNEEEKSTDSSGKVIGQKIWGTAFINDLPKMLK